MTGFHEQLATGWRASGSMMCVGLDPAPGRHDGDGDAVFAFCRDLVDAVGDLVCAVKPQIAHFSAQRAEVQLERLCTHVREQHPHVTIILDAKRGDVESTSRHYASEAFDRYGVHAVTVNPYLGTDAAAPFLTKGGVIALCRTSNPGAGELQDLDVDGRPLYLHVAEMVATRWAELGECGLVTGATAAHELARVRKVARTLPLLVPGLGAQGGDVAASVHAGATADGAGLIMSASRSVMYPAGHDGSADDIRLAASRAEAQRLHAEIRAALQAPATAPP